jgi:gamma-glutamylcyclotransferase (GGCT)/AIG2-like uncharacterized protein YtfP
MDLYFAYGFNTQRSGMARRCPDARSLGSARLPDYAFRFAYHADVIPERGSTVAGVLWRVTPQCMANLDRVEGYPTYYDRKAVDVFHGGSLKRAWVYVMQPGSFETAPPECYLDQLIEGYSEHGVSHVQIIRGLVSAQRTDLEYGQYHSRYPTVSRPQTEQAYSTQSDTGWRKYSRRERRRQRSN